MPRGRFHGGGPNSGISDLALNVSELFEGNDLTVAGAEHLAATMNLVRRNNNGLNVFFVLATAYLVFIMQAGFAMLTAGSVRTKNTKNVLLKNVLDTCVSAIAYWLFGHSFAYGQRTRAPGFIGSGEFALSGAFGVASNVTALVPGAMGTLFDFPRAANFHNFFSEWAVAVTSATIVSGSVAERASFYAYLAYAFFLVGFVHPVVSHWVWGNGFLATLFGPRTGMIDFAGSAVVHMVGGVAGLVGAVVVGPRLGRFDSTGMPTPIPGHSATLVTLGTFVLWFGWYGFNAGSAVIISPGGANAAERCCVTTTIAGASAGLVTLLVVKQRDHIFDLIATLNGILAGLVSITASCAFVHPYAALIIGVVGALVYIGTAMLLLRLRIDDPLEAFPVHGAAGLWGILAVGLFNVREFQEHAGYTPEIWGAFYGGGGLLFAANLAGALIISAWTAVLIGALFLVMRFTHVLRISPEEELIGNDLSKHGGVAYPDDASIAPDKYAQETMEAYVRDGSGPASVPDSPVPIPV